MKIKLSLVVVLVAVCSFMFAGCKKEESASAPAMPSTNAPASTNAP